MQGRQFTRRVAKRFFGFIAASVGLFLALALPGCGDSDPGSRAGSSHALGSDEVRRLLHRPSASIQVSPSTQDQTLTVLGVGVTVPGALLGTPQPLSVTALSDASLSRPMPEMQTVGVYDIALGAASTFDKPLVLEFPYNAAALGDGAAQGKNLWVAYWDTARQQWVRANATVDAARQKITVSTDHLSTWWIYRLRGYDYVPKGRMSWFEVYFNPKHVNPRTDVAGQTMQGLAEDVLAALETARENYKTAGFKLPSASTSVFIADVPDSNWGKWGGAIDLKRAEMSTADKIRNDSAHELFHAVQNQYYFTAGMAQRFWFMEGTPDFMAYHYGWNGSITSQIEPLSLSWFEHSPFENLTDVDAYPLGNFLRYLNQTEGMDIKELWDYMVSWPINVPQAFRSGVLDQTGSAFDDVWFGFVTNAMFGSQGLAKSPFHTLVLDKRTNSASLPLSLSPNYTAKLVAVRAGCDDGNRRSVKFSTGTNLPGSSKIALWTATPYGLNPVYQGALFTAGQSIANILLDDETMLFAVAMNNTASETIPLTLAVDAADCRAKTFSWAEKYRAIVLLGGNPIEADASVGITAPADSVLRARYLGPGTAAAYLVEFARIGAEVPTQISVSATPSSGSSRWEASEGGDTVEYVLESLSCRAARKPHSSSEVSLGSGCSINYQLDPVAEGQAYRIYGRYLYTRQVFDSKMKPKGSKEYIEGERIMIELYVL